MPFVEIFVSNNTSTEELNIISDILHDQLVAHFNVPKKDKFHVFHRLPEDQRFFDLHYGVSKHQRTQDWLLIKILAGKPRTEEAKQALYQALAKHFQAKLNLAPSDLMVTIYSNEIGDWSFSEGRQASLPTIEEISA